MTSVKAKVLGPSIHTEGCREDFIDDLEKNKGLCITIHEYRRDINDNVSFVVGSENGVEWNKDARDKKWSTSGMTGIRFDSMFKVIPDNVLPEDLFVL